MSLYFDAASILTQPSASIGGSFKSRLYQSQLKSPPAQIYALIIEASKWDVVLKEVVENAGILPLEPKLTPLLSVLLAHDFLLSKKGIAAPAAHPLRLAIERHKNRLKAEFVKARIRRQCASIDQLKASIAQMKRSQGGESSSIAPYVRWVRINNVRTTLDDELRTTFASYKPVSSLRDVASAEGGVYYIDKNVPDLLALPHSVELTSSQAYKGGKIILQDKASCFPAYLLLGDQLDGAWKGDLVDACAAPGNKTTHLASLLCSKAVSNAKIYSMDASQHRSKTLQKMVGVAGADKITKVLPGQDFLALDPLEDRFKSVTALLLDPSCSGSGIVGRDDVPRLTLPTAASGAPASRPGEARGRHKKRKRGPEQQQQQQQLVSTPPDDDALPAEEVKSDIDAERLSKLANLQLRIVEHAFSFPFATRVAYSTCSIHSQENESVVFRALGSEVAKRRGWRILPRDQQCQGMREWKYRGVSAEEDSKGQSDYDGSWSLSEEEREACIRCWPNDEECMGGFFVAGFVREPGVGDDDVNQQNSGQLEEEEDEWEGFSSD
ncbi:hypothetical protein AJ80_03221 [Polytolypa hystricis UAMH7299]|uniref:SAM-dependent MTase RsmB/NOP-type domain-containing protein n=1 Tax=Polytolypa hystricis (strain UAMH7299) TaxID=1447883 RepID=A0A2B7YJS6_POLH7|nr:hypothetical protein AJ80_03221 [Polytolypa hystricis UAMH7299]